MAEVEAFLSVLACNAHAARTKASRLGTGAPSSAVTRLLNWKRASCCEKRIQGDGSMADDRKTPGVGE